MTSADVIALSSAVIACCAFFATVWQAWLAHQHNRLSVRPLLVWHVARRNSPESAGIAFTVRNLGLGPAVIRERYFSKDNVRFHAPDLQSDEVQAFVAHVFGTRTHYHLKQFGLPGKDGAIPSQGELLIADIEFPSLPASKLELVVQLAGDVAFHINYESMYGEKYKLEAR
jgi:hypothetical protein